MSCVYQELKQRVHLAALASVLSPQLPSGGGRLEPLPWLGDAGGCTRLNRIIES